MNKIEIIGIAATLLVFASMCFRTISYKGSILMRTFNIVGSLVFVIYGALLPAISTAVLNGGLIIVNSIHLVLLIVKQKKINKEKNIIKEDGKEDIIIEDDSSKKVIEENN